jgi:hypothetical protein
MIAPGQSKDGVGVARRPPLSTLAPVVFAPVALAALALVVLTLPGCGPNGDASVGLPGTKTPVPRLAGVVLEPNGELVKAGPLWWPGSVDLVARAYAQTNNVEPVGPDELVTLSLIDQADAADGQLGNTGGHTPLVIAYTNTNPDGSYEILNAAVGDVDVCRLMVSVGSGPTLTRAFVFNSLTNIDYKSEAVVRVVLDRLTMAPPVQLCDFTSAGLKSIADAVAVATVPASGDTVFTINADAFALAEASCRVQAAIEQATNVPVQPPPHCVGTPPPG